MPAFAKRVKEDERFLDILLSSSRDGGQSMILTRLGVSGKNLEALLDWLQGTTRDCSVCRQSIAVVVHISHNRYRSQTLRATWRARDPH
jgi:hypothetical protein